MEINRTLLKEYKNNNTIISLSCVGDSMSPLIRDKGVIFVSCCQLMELRPGDIVVFIKGANVACHRCIEVRKGCILEKGDNCGLWRKLNEVEEQDIIGKVISILNSGEQFETPLDSFTSFNKFMVGIGLISNFFSFCNSSLEDTDLKSSGMVNRLISILIDCVFSISYRRMLNDYIKIYHD